MTAAGGVGLLVTDQPSPSALTEPVGVGSALLARTMTADSTSMRDGVRYRSPRIEVPQASPRRGGDAGRRGLNGDARKAAGQNLNLSAIDIEMQQTVTSRAARGQDRTRA